MKPRKIDPLLTYSSCVCRCAELRSAGSELKLPLIFLVTRDVVGGRQSDLECDRSDKNSKVRELQSAHQDIYQVLTCSSLPNGAILHLLKYAHVSQTIHQIHTRYQVYKHHSCFQTPDSQTHFHSIPKNVLYNVRSQVASS